MHSAARHMVDAQLAASCCRWGIAQEQNRAVYDALVNATTSNTADQLRAVLESGVVGTRPPLRLGVLRARDVVDVFSGETLLHIAMRGQLRSGGDHFRALAALGCDVNARDLAGRAPLHTLALVTGPDGGRAAVCVLYALPFERLPLRYLLC